MIRLATAFATLALGAAVVACGSETQPAGPRAFPTTSVDTTAVLLTTSDVGAGWTANTELSVADLGSLGESPCQDVAVNPTILERLRPRAGIIFEPGDGSMRGIQELLVTGDEARLQADLDAVFGAVQSCYGTPTTTADGERVTYEPFALPDLGDQRLGARITVAEPPDFQRTWHGHTAIVRVGGTAVMVNQFEILDDPTAQPVMTDEEYTSLLERAVERLGG